MKDLTFNQAMAMATMVAEIMEISERESYEEYGDTYLNSWAAIENGWTRDKTDKIYVEQRNSIGTTSAYWVFAVKTRYGLWHITKRGMRLRG